MSFQIINPHLRFPQQRARRARTDSIVLHHLDAHWDVHRTHQHHLSIGWNGIGYNLHVAMNGIISLGRGIEFQGAHKLGFNDRAIGIGCEGRFHSVDRTMPDVQFNALVWLIRHLREIYGDIRILGHRDYNATACPGQFFPLVEARTLQFRGTADNTKTEENEEVTQEQFNQMMETYLTEQRRLPVSEWARDSWEFATENGTTDGTNPRLSATREQVIVMLDRLGLLE